MSERGVFAVDRGVFDHPKLSNSKPLSKLEAWLWLLSTAAWKPVQRRISGHTISLRRGELAASTRFMATRWRWTEPRVRRFLALLKSDADNGAEIDTQTDAGVTVITICKYDRYQRVSLPIDACADAVRVASIDARATQDRRKEEDIEDTQGSEAKASVAPIYTDARHQLWAEGVPTLVSLGEKEARSRQMVGLWLKQTCEDATQVLGAIQRARDLRVHGPVAWISRALNKGTGNANRNNRSDSRAGHGSSREADFFSALGKGAIEYLENRQAAGSIRKLSAGTSSSGGYDARSAATKRN